MSENVRATFIRRPELMQITGLSSSAIDRRIEKGLLVPPVNLGGRAVAWVSYEVDAVMNAFIAEKSADEIRDLIDSLLRDRQIAA